ncbi:MAG: TraB/GumN family protein [Chryseobacterium sp.]|uniref:TraB/GumN family protein n=1 Tax=Chryseobacterium sp. TaxID=1871047 RepID=UPI0025C0F9DE|nr:TraB/GumN family protein [Chryseobacterium sp.]MCJ7933760.1 TraB/GumN family protein [Chryseobacterium sp.]
MKNFLRLGFSAWLSIASITAEAQNKNRDYNGSLLWEVSGNGLSKPSYITGTFHTLCSKDFEIKPKVLKALDKTENFMLEVNFTDPSEISAVQAMFQAEKKISDQVTADEAKEYDNILKGYGTNLKNVDHYMPQALYSLLSSKILSCPPAEARMYDIELLKIAMQHKKNIAGLEKIADQTNILGQAYGLKEVMQQLKLGHEYAVCAQKMIEAFKKEDLQALDKLIRDKRFMDAKQGKIILDERNKSWTEKMPDIMRKQSTFFAVGSGHLLGDNGLIHLLTKKGYTVKPVVQLQ